MNACHNRKELKTRVVVQDGWFMDGVTRMPRMVTLPVRNTTDCRYTLDPLGQADKGCEGCKWRVVPPAG